jgi:hypothetical protein
MIATEPLPDINSFSSTTRIFARVISYLFHPLFIPVYVIAFVVYELHYFPELDNWHKKLVVIQFLVSYTFLPLLTILLMKALGFIQSIHLNTQKDRILPYVVCEIFYFWGWYVSKNLSYFPDVVIMFTLAVFLACSLGLILNSYLKISMHGIALGTLCAFMILASLQARVSFGWYVSAAFLIAGVTCTARLIDSNHSAKEVYAGLFAGALMQVVAYWFV